MPRRHGIARRRASASLRLWRSLLLVTVAASACDGGVGRCESSAWLRGARPPDGPSVDALHRLVDVLHHPPLRGGGRRHVSGVKVESGRAGAEAASHKSAHDSHSCVARAAVKKDRKRGRHCPGTDGVRTGEERRLGKKIRVRREGADTHRQRSSDKRSAEKSSKRRKKKSSTKDKEGRKKRRTKDKEGRECTEPQAAPEPAAPKTSVAPKPEEGLDKKPQGMALARKLMTKMGWGGDGHGLGKNATGIARPMEAKVKKDTLGIGARRESQAARQRREFQEIEEQAFPSFPARPLPMPNGRRGDGQGCIIVGDEDFVGKVQGQTVIVGKTKSDGAGGAEAGRLAADDDTEEGDEEEASTSTVSSSSSLGEPVLGKIVPPPTSPPAKSPWGAKNAPFRRVLPDDPEVAEFKRQTGYNYEHRQFQTSKDCSSVGNRGAMRLNPHRGKNFKKQKQKLKDRAAFGTIDVNYRNSNRVVFNYDDE